MADFADVYFSKLCTEASISVLKQNKNSINQHFGIRASGNGILTIGKCKFTILQNETVSCRCKDSILSPECLAYWSRWLEIML